MQTIALALVIIVLTVLLSVFGLWLTNRVFGTSLDERDNEVAMTFLQVLGTIYGIQLAFVVVVAWQRFENARDTVEREGNALASLFRETNALPEPEARRALEIGRGYGRAVIDEEWPALDTGQRSTHAIQLMDDLWQAMTAIEPSGDRETTIYTSSLQHLNDLNDARRVRLLASQGGLPAIMWVLLIGGGIVSLIITYFLSSPNLRARAAMTALYAASVSFVLFLIAVIDYPFHGDVRVTPEPLELALEAIARLGGQ